MRKMGQDFLLLFLLEYNWFKMLCQFPLYNRGAATRRHRPLTPESLCHPPDDRGVVMQQLPRAVWNPHGGVCMPLLISSFITPSPSHCVHKFILHVSISAPALQADTAVPSLTATAEGFRGGSDGKASAYDAGDTDSGPGSGRSPEGGNGNPLQYSCLQNPMDGGTWQATVHGVAKSWTWLSDFSF